MASSNMGAMTDALGSSDQEKVLKLNTPLSPAKATAAAALEGAVVRDRNYHRYPKPLAEYKEVVADPKLFVETLEKLHAAMATKFMVPTIGGRELDLHRLFVEVTSRGGIDKVIANRRWREVTAVFSFPSTATNASFVLRKYYISLLRNYEKIYFFGSQGYVIPPIAPLDATSVATTPSDERYIDATTPSAPQKRKKRAGDFTYIAGPSLPENREVSGVIDGKFEQGYFVSVTIGTMELRGVLYPAPEHPVANSSVKDVRRRRRRRMLSKRDPTHPKSNRSGYNFFFAEQHARLKPLHPGKDREISKMIGDLWNNLTDTDKAVYQEKGLRDKERYQSEMVVYRERLLKGQVISNAVPIQQRPAMPEVITEGAGSELEMGGLDFTLTNENDNSCKGSDSERNMSGDDSETETETSPEVDGTTAEESTVLPVEHSAEAGFELRQRDHIIKNEDEHDPLNLNHNAESEKGV